MVQDQAIKTLFVTLRRSQAGKPWFHRRVLESLGLRKRLTCVEKPNNAIIRGMLRKVCVCLCVTALLDTQSCRHTTSIHSPSFCAPPLRAPHTTSHCDPPGCPPGGD